MIRIVCGDIGSGKTKKLITTANGLAEKTSGSVVFIGDDRSCIYELISSIRFIDSKEYKITSPKMFIGFLLGITAQDFDLEYIFVDGFLRIVRHELATLGEMFSVLADFAEKHKIDIVISISSSYEELPDFLRDYVEK